MPTPALHAIALVIVAATAATGLAVDASGHLRFDLALATHLVATAAYLWLAYRITTGRERPGFAWALALVVLMQVVCLLHGPSLSDDIYRYLHEGRLVLAGVNPYTLAPEATAPELRGPYFDLINNADIPAAYPPACQYALAAGAALSDEPLGMKLVFGACSVLVFVVLWRWLPLLGIAAPRALIWGACPLIAIEFAGQGHSDSLAVLFVVLALWLSSRARSVAASAALGVATAAKFMPAVLLPFVLRDARSRRRWLAATAFAIALIALYTPFLAAPSEMFRGLTEYAVRWRSNDSLFALMHYATEAFIDLGWFADLDTKLLKEPQRLSKIPLAILFGAVMLWRWRRGDSAHRAAFWLFATFIALAPTVHPWYVAFVVPFLCLYPSYGLMAFTGTVFMTYHVLPRWHAEGVWEERAWVVVVEYVPFYVGLLGAWRSDVATRREAAGARASGGSS